MIAPHDRLSGEPGVPEAGWTGRWSAGGVPLLDVVDGSSGRDSLESDDLDSIRALELNLSSAARSGSWLAIDDVPLLAGHDEESLQLQARERILEANIASVARVCERYITRLSETSELLPVSRVKRPARKALDRLSAHTEDWAARTLSGPVPRRALAVTRKEDADLYENRMVSELVHPILTSALNQRIRRLRRLSSDLADLERAKDEGTHHRRTRLYTFWGADAVRAAESQVRTAQTLHALEALAAWVQALRGSALARHLRGRRTGQRTLRNTNVIANDRHYHAAGLVWSAYEREPEVDETPEEREAKFLSRHRAFDDYVLGLVIRSLGDLRYGPDEDQLPVAGRPLTLRGPWGDATLARGVDGVLTLTSHGQSTRIVPLLDLVGPNDDHPTIAARWTSVAEAVTGRTVVVYLAAFAAIRHLPHDLAIVMSSAGSDALSPGTATGLPVSPLETTSLERVARAVAEALLAPALLNYPAPILLGGDRVPRRLIEHLDSSGITQPGLSPLFYRRSADEIFVRRPFTTNEAAALEAAIRQLTDRTKSPGWESDVKTEIGELYSAIENAAAATARLLVCPLCRARADPSQVGREGDIAIITCRSCEARWGHERCGVCGSRVPVIEPERELRNAAVTGPGWVERIYGRDALSSPCWARMVPGRYVCPDCRSCSVSSSPEGANCPRCHLTRTSVASML